jgi:hypothetical protein
MATWTTGWIDFGGLLNPNTFDAFPVTTNLEGSNVTVSYHNNGDIAPSGDVWMIGYEVEITVATTSVPGQFYLSDYYRYDDPVGLASGVAGYTINRSGAIPGGRLIKDGMPLLFCNFESGSPGNASGLTWFSARGRYQLTDVNPDGYDPEYPWEPDDPEEGAQSEVFVHTLNAGKGKWSRYLFPFQIDAFSQLSGELFIRTGDTVVKVKEGVLTDHVNGANVGFAGRVQWPWIDAGQPGATKQLIGFDLVASGQPFVSVGYNQSDTEMFTEPYPVPADTLTGGVIPMPLMAPSFSLRLDFAKNEAWNMRSAALYLNDGKWQP